MSDVEQGKVFGKYKLLAHLATGGMADIFLARQTGIAGFEKLLVIKRILPHLAREEFFVKMFLDEARIAARLNHQNVVQTNDLGCEGGQYFIAMEFLEGESLAEVMRYVYKLKERIPPYIAAGIMLQACDGLHHAHSMVGPDGKPMRLVHRDVTPQNIFVLYTGGVKLMDFGIAKATYRSSHTTTGTLKGKFKYMSPEQVKNLPLDARSDVFSAGVVFWEMLTGRRLFSQSTELDILTAIAQQDAPKPSTVNPDVPGELEEIAMRALRRSREERYQSAAEMRMDLATAIKQSNEPSDTVAIGEYVRWLFYDRMVEKQLLVKKALSHGADLGEALFNELPGAGSDSSPSGQASDGLTPERSSIKSETPNEKEKEAAAGRPKDSATGQGKAELWKTASLVLLGLIFLVSAILLLLEPWSKSVNDKVEPLPPLLFNNKATTNADSVAGPAGATLKKNRIGEQGGQDAEQNRAQKKHVENKSEQPDESRISKKKHEAISYKGNRAKNKRKRPEKKFKKKHIEKAGLAAPGKLRFDTIPWTTVYLGGKKLGVTPLVDVKLPPGRHVLRVVNEAKNINKKIEVQIREGKTTVKWFRF
ncbi:MAG: protein kinase [Deltaproteobacteria bacterium]|nr:protein kinase [Deltaproteobacteria bacterium]